MKTAWKTICLMLVLALAAVVAAPAAVTAQDNSQPVAEKKDKKAKKKDKKTAKKEEGGDAKKKDKEKPFKDVVKEMEKIEGLFTFYRDNKEGKVLLEILPAQLDADFIYSSKVERGTGERGIYGTIMMNNFVFQFHKQGKRIQMIRPNTRFMAEPGSPAERAVANSFSDSLFGAAKIMSKPHEERGSFLINLGDIFLSGDLHNFGTRLKVVYGPGYKFLKDDSAFTMVKSFPHNSEIGTTVRFQGNGPIKRGSTTLPDTRNLTVGFRYSLVAMPENDYMARYADDRLGYFLDMHMDFTSDKPDTPYVRMINRWNLKKKNPEEKLSEPVEPIVYWIENSTPKMYRPWIAEGIEMWQAAFEEAGFKNAIIAKVQPDDAEWDPADIRYNTLRWFVGYDATFAIGPSHTNPYTGEILDADIGISEGILRLAARRRYKIWVDPVARLQGMLDEPVPMPGMDNGFALRGMCRYGEELHEMASRAHDLMSTRPGWNAEKEMEFMRQYTAELVAHEVGHTLGLRHNFRSSLINNREQIGDKEHTDKVGLAASVMDYNPPMVALEGETQGDYLQTTVGSYDKWVIRYGYTPIDGANSPEDEADELAKIAGQVADWWHPYATDEDAGLGARSLDPRNTRYDFSSDPLEHFAHEYKLIRELWSNMEEKLIQDGDSYELMRTAFGQTWTPYFRGGLVAAKYIGGIHHNRDHAGDPNGRLPFVPVPAEEQRKALDFIANNVWAADTFNVPADMLNKLQFPRHRDFNFSAFTTQRLDYPLHNIAGSVQAAPLGSLFHPLRLQRLQDQELTLPAGDNFSMADMFNGVREAIWSEVAAGSNVDSFRRNLQRAHLDTLINLIIKPAKGTPHDAVTLARADLVDLKKAATKALNGGSLDRVTRAHLEETSARIEAALTAQVSRGL